MKEQSYKVHVIVDRAFGERLHEIPVGEPVWIVDTEVNRVACEALRKEWNSENHLTGITSFKVKSNASPEDWLISEVETIDLHHPLWSVINVIGTGLTVRIQDELTRFGFKEHKNTAEGFIMLKKSSSYTSDSF